MREFRGYDEMMSDYYEKLSNYMLPLLSWEFYGEVHEALGMFKEDLGALNKLSKNWVLNESYRNELIDNQSVVIVTNSNLKIVYASNNIEKLNGYLPEEVIGNSPKMFQGQGTCMETSAKVRAAVDKGMPFEVRLLNYRKDATTYTCMIKGFPIHNKKGKVINYIAFEKAA